MNTYVTDAMVEVRTRVGVALPSSPAAEDDDDMRTRKAPVVPASARAYSAWALLAASTPGDNTHARFWFRACKHTHARAGPPKKKKQVAMHTSTATDRETATFR